jgi:hypothetical protein
VFTAGREKIHLWIWSKKQVTVSIFDARNRKLLFKNTYSTKNYMGLEPDLEKPLHLPKYISEKLIVAALSFSTEPFVFMPHLREFHLLEEGCILGIVNAKKFSKLKNFEKIGSHF